jgi:hypothetical protein
MPALRLARAVDALGYLVGPDGLQAAQVVPRPRSVAQDVGTVIRELGGAPLADDDPGQDAGSDQLRQQIQFGRGQRGRGVVAADQVKGRPEQVRFGRKLVGGGDGDVVDQRGHGHVTEVDDAADTARAG